MISRRRFLGSCGRGALAAPLAGWLAPLLPGGGAAAGAAAAGEATPDVERWTRSVCDLCGLGEPVFLRTAGGRLRAVKGIATSRTGFGRLCPRAEALVAAAVTEDRAVRPLLRRDPATKGTREGLEPVTWEVALAAITDGLRVARERSGPSGVAVGASDAETCETYLRLARLARATWRTDHLDTPARLDGLHAYDACERVFGTSANPSSVEDVDAAGLILLIGGDLADSHPGLYTRVLDARRTGRARVALVDSRKTLAAALADVHVRPRPGRELAVVHALAAGLLADGAVPPEARAWAQWLRGTAGAPGALAAAGVDRPSIDAILREWRAARGVVTLVGPVALSSTAGAPLARAVAQLHRATGQWGGAGRGCLFLPRGANVTGVVAAGVRPGHLPAGLRLDVPADRERIAAAWGVAAETLPVGAGLAMTEWPAAVRDGRLGALFLLRTNVAAEMPDAAAWREALGRCFCVVASTHVPSETTAFADVVLPLAMVAGESSGTMMSLDRRCQRLEMAQAPPQEARTAERILADLAGEDPAAPATDEWESWRDLARGTPFDATGIPALRLAGELDVAWPCAAEGQPGTVRLDAASAGAAEFVRTPSPADLPSPSAARPLLLIVGPLREHAGSRVRTGRTPELHYEAPVAQLEIHPEDAVGDGIVEGDWVTVESDTGSATMRVWLTDRVAKGTVFLPEHYGSVSDLQGGATAQDEPEGLALLIVGVRRSPEGGAPSALPMPVSVRKARRRDLRQRGI